MSGEGEKALTNNKKKHNNLIEKLGEDVNVLLTEKQILMVYKQIRRFWTAFVIKQMQIKTAKYHFNLDRQIHGASEFIGK